MSNISKQALRERYSSKPTPKCDICGDQMTIQRISGSRVTYGCSGAIYDETGCHYAAGRSLADDHYEQSRVTVTDDSDPDVLELMDELEAAEKRIAELEARELVVNLPAYVDGRTLGYGEVNHMIDLCADAIEKAGHSAGIITKVGE